MLRKVKFPLASICWTFSHLSQERGFETSLIYLHFKTEVPFSDNDDKFKKPSYAICYFSFHGQVKSSIADYAQMDPEAEGYPGNNVGKGSQNS